MRQMGTENRRADCATTVSNAASAAVSSSPRRRSAITLRMWRILREQFARGAGAESSMTDPAHDPP